LSDPWPGAVVGQGMPVTGIEFNIQWWQVA
jgi:hypothetical protein